MVALYSEYKHIPVVTWAPVQRRVMEKDNFEQVFSTFGAYEDFAESATQAMRYLHWTNVGETDTTF